MKLLAGLLRPNRGELKIYGSVRVLPQNPQTLFVKKTMKEDLYEISRGRELPVEVQEKGGLCDGGRTDPVGNSFHVVCQCVLLGEQEIQYHFSDGTAGNHAALFYDF